MATKCFISIGSMLSDALIKSNFWLSVKSKQRLFCFCLTPLCDWSKTLMPLSQPIKCKAETNHDSTAHLFLHFRQFAQFYYEFSTQLLCKVTFLSSGWSVITLGLVLCHSIKKRSLTQPAYSSPQTQLYNPASYTCTQCAHCWFNPLIFKISLVILLTVCQMILIMLVWRIWYQIN